MRIPAMLLVVPLLAAAAACGADEGDEFPTGTYQSIANPGTVMVFEEGGTFTAANGPMLAAGTYSVKGEELKILTDSFCAASSTPTATYTWSWDGTTLAMTPTTDDCANRASDLSGGLLPSFPRTSYVADDDSLLTLNADGTWRWGYLTIDANGTYETNGTTLTWLTDSHCRGNERGTYTWAWDGTTLQLTAVQDDCAARVGVATVPKVLTTATPSPSS
jgi:hypothetical protein